MTHITKNSPLKKLRTFLQLTLKEMSDIVGIEVGNLSRIERGLQRSIDGAQTIATEYDGLITESHIIYPDQYPDYQPETKAA